MSAEFADVRWRKSSRSNGEALCVEVAWNGEAGAAIRDSKQSDRGPILTIDHRAWTSFMSVVKSGDTDLL